MRRLVILLALLTALLPRPAAAQSDDPGILTRFLQDNLSAAGREVKVTGFRGALSSLARIDRITIADDQGIWLTLNGIALDWNRTAVLAGRFSVNSLTADEIIVARRPVASPQVPVPEARGFALPNLPISVNIGRLAAAKVDLGPDVLGEPLHASIEASLTLAGGEGQTTLLLTRTDAGPAGRVALTASYANATRNLVIDLEATEEAGGIAATLIGLPGAPATELTVKGQGIIDDFAADIRLATDGIDRLTGRVELKTDAKGANGFAARLGGNVAPLFLPDYAEFFGPDVRLDMAGRRAPSGALDLQRLSVQTQAMTLDGSLRLAPDGLPEVLSLTGRIAHADGTAVLLPTTGEDRLYIDRADLTVGFDGARDEGWSAQVTLAGLDHPAIRAGQVLLSGSGRISRTPQGNQVGATVRLLAADLAPTDPGLAQALGTGAAATLRAVWQEGQPLRLSEVALAGADYTLSARGQIDDLAAGLRLNGQMTVDAADLARFSGLAGRPLGGRAMIEGSGTGSLLGGDFDIEAGIRGYGLSIGTPEIDNLLRGETTIALSAARDGSGTVLRQLDLSAATLSVNAKGRLASAGSDLTADLEFADLSVLGPSYRGALTATAKAVGTIEAGSLTLDGQGRDLAIGQTQADGLLRGQSSLSVALRSDKGAVVVDRATISNPQVSADLSGRVDGAATDIGGTVRLANLRPLGPGFGGSLTAKARATGTARTGTLTLDAQASGLSVGQPQADRLLAGQSSLSLALRTEGGAVRVDKAKLANPQLTVDATGRTSGTTRRVDLTATLRDLGLVLPEFPGALTIAGSAVDDGTGYRVDLTGKGPGKIDARVTGRMASNLSRADLALTGTGQAALANPFIAPQSVDGPLRFDLRLNGPLALNSVSGRVALAGGRIAIPAAPFSLQGVNAQADLARGRAQLAVTAGVSSGGSIEVRGPVSLTAPFDGDLSVGLRDVVLRDPDLYEVRAVGQLRVNGPLTGGALISGAITLPNAEIRVPTTDISGAGAIPDLTHVNEPAAVRLTRARAGLILTAADRDRQSGTARRPFRLDVTVNAPNQIFLRGRGLDAELGGAVRVRGTTDAPSPSGEIRLLRGRLDILGRRLDLTEAQITLGGSLDPVLRVVASTTSDGITSNVVISGLISDPQVSFTSVPPLPDEEVIAHLLFGRDLSQLSAFQAAQLAGAVATLAGRGGDGIIARLRKGFGLDDLDVVTSEDGSASLRVGKYISKKVYSEVVVGNKGTTQLNLNLDIRPGVTARASAGSDGQTGIGIFVDRDY
jgi:translocation and assembly module TamB